MKRCKLFLVLVALTFISLISLSCNHQDGNKNGNTQKGNEQNGEGNGGGNTTPEEANLVKEIKAKLEAEMVLVPVPESGIECTLGYDDKGNDAESDALVFGGNVKTFYVHKPFKIGKFEVDYKLFFDVRNWAEKHGYKFANKGLEGSDKGEWDEKNKIYKNEGAEPTAEGENLPCTMVSSNDIIVYLNALSELLGLEAVYYKDASFSSVLKDAGERAVDSSYTLKGAALECHMAKVKPDATGFRLPTEKEWEVAAKWQGPKDEGNSENVAGYYFTKGNSLSGVAGDFKNEEECKKVAWFKKNAEGKAHKKGEKKSNALGLFDMSGNVYEFTFLKHSGGHTLKGGSYQKLADDCTTTAKISAKPEDRWEHVGFRLCQGVQSEVIHNEEPTDIDAMLEFPAFASPVTVPIAIDDSESETLKAPFKIGKYEVCNKLFYEVLAWAEGKGYSFSFKKGTLEKSDELKPVRNVSWYDAVVWCNAYSEMSGFNAVYYDATKTNVLKNSKQSEWDKIIKMSRKGDANGFRLPSMAEWQAAARLRSDNVNAVQGKSFASKDGKTYYFTRGNALSGLSFNYDDEVARNMYSVNAYNSDGAPCRIASKKPNEIGAFDMSGNVWEWCFEHEIDGNERFCMNLGGGFIGSKFHWLSCGNANPLEVFRAPETEAEDLGFRVCRN